MRDDNYEARMAWRQMCKQFETHGMKWRSMKCTSNSVTPIGGTLHLELDLRLGPGKHGKGVEMKISMHTTRQRKVEAVAWMDQVDENGEVVDLIFVLLSEWRRGHGQRFEKQAPTNKTHASRSGAKATTEAAGTDVEII